MNKAESLHLQILNELPNYQVDKLDPYFLSLFKRGGRDLSYWQEIYRQHDYPSYYYHYLATAVKLLDAKQVVEIGADKGASAIMMALEGADVYSLDIRDGWEYVKETQNPSDKIHKIHPIVGNSLNIEVFNMYPDLKLEDTDLWLIDGLHTQDQVTREMATYMKYFAPGSVVILDDVDQLGNVWENVSSDKFLSLDIHGKDGVGIIAI